MKCSRCQALNRDGAQYCRECGFSLDSVCPRCGAFLDAESRFCDACGARFVGPLSADATSHPRPDPGRSDQVAKRISGVPSDLEGERKQVTILFADLKDSLELLAGQDPEESRRLLDPLLDLMMSAVHRYEGTVNQIMGDGIMAIFGAPVAHEDHAIRACYAALQMRASIAEHAKTIGVSSAPLMRIGLNSGEVVVRSIRNDLHMDYSAVGQTTHLAARMEQLAKPGSILLSASTFHLAESAVEAASLGPLAVKGLGHPIHVYELIRALSDESKQRRIFSIQPVTPFVGREMETQHLGLAADKAANGQGQLVAVIGEPGIGKSRLFLEFGRLLQGKGWFLLETTGVSYERNTPYLPLVKLIKRYLGIVDHDTTDEVRAKVVSGLRELDDELRSGQPAILFLLEALPAGDPFRELDPPARRALILEALKRLVLWATARQPVLLMVENLHWIDAETQAFLDAISDSLPTARLLLLVNYRPGYQHGWGSKSFYTQLPLQPMSYQSARQLLAALIGTDARLDALKQLLMGRAEGNPFFLEETVRSLFETGALVEERGCQLTRPLETIEVPVTVQAVLAARIDRLSRTEKRALQAAAVIGKDVPYSILKSILGLPEDQLRRSLANLQAAELLYESGLFGDPQFTFRHALTHDVAYGSLLRENRREVHHAVLAAAEQVYATRLSDHVEQLAHHAFLGETWDKAARYSRLAGVKAAERSASRDAVAHFDQALLALRQLPASREVHEQVVDIRFELRNALLPFGELGKIVDHLREAEALAHELGDRRRGGRVSAYMAQYLCWIGDHAQAIEAGQRALRIAEELSDLSLRVVTHLLFGQVYHAVGDYRNAVDLFGRNVTLLGGNLADQRFGLAAPPSVQSLAMLAWCLAELGEFDEATQRGEQALELAERSERPRDRIVAARGLGAVYVRRGDVSKAIPMLERAVEMCRLAHISTLLPTVAGHLGYAYVLARRPADAVPVLTEAVEQSESMKIVYGQALLLSWLGQAHLAAGAMDEAIQVAERGLELARYFREQGHEAWALLALGETHAQTQALSERTITYYEDGLTLAGKLAMRPLVARGHLALSRLLASRQRADAAAEHQRKAEQLLTSMGMHFWLGNQPLS